MRWIIITLLVSVLLLTGCSEDIYLVGSGSSGMVDCPDGSYCELMNFGSDIIYRNTTGLNDSIMVYLE